MAYTPPGVYTEVEIASNIVQLPGGTRVLAIIGLGKKTLSVDSEQVTQNSTRVNTLVHTGLVGSISGAYDFSGPGGGLVVYPSTGITINNPYGSGWWLSGTSSIAWTPAANPYPISTTPAIGSTYYATYSYSGTTLTGTTLIAPVASGTETTNAATNGVSTGFALSIPNVTEIVGVWDGADISSAAEFSGTGIGSGGSGYFLSGSSLYWTNGNLADFAAAVATLSVPASGSEFWVHYNYTGVVASQAYTQSGTYTTLAITSAALLSGLTTILSPASGNMSISGASVASYAFSGTATNPDSSGYATANSGWNVTGTAPSQYITWSEVPVASYAYPPRNVPRVSGVYFVNYEYDKSLADYAPKNFFDYSQVVNEYGDEANWAQDANGNWVFQSLNTLTLAARIAFANGASIVNLTQMSGNGLSVGNFYAPLNQLQTKLVDIIVPLTGGSGSSFNEVSVSEKGLILQAVKQHCDTMSLPQNRKERVSVGSLGPAEIGDSTTANTYVYDASNVLVGKRATLIAPGIATVQIQDPAGNFQNVAVDASFMAVAYGALSCNPNSDVATPLTNQQFASFTRTSAATSGHPESDYLESEMNTLAAAGIAVIASQGSRIFVRQQLTTDQSNQANGEFSVVTTTDYVSQAVRFTTEQFIGKKLISAVVLPAIKSTILATMQALAGEAIINAIGAITVITNPNNPTEVLSTVQYVPVFPLNRIRVTFTIRTTI